jgi:hypothetical protein
MGVNLSLGDFEKSLITEISALSGHSVAMVRDVLEATFLRQLEQHMNDKDITIPFVGDVHIKYLGDNLVSGNRLTDMDCFIAPSELLKRLVGDIQDGESDIITQLLQRKIKSALQVKLEE